MKNKDNNDIFCYNIMIKKERFFLPIFLTLGVLALEEIRDFVYMPFIVTPCFFVLFLNFPIIVYCANSKPLYYEDLFIDEKKLPNYEVSEQIKTKFERIYKWSIISTTSLLTGALSDYWLYKTVNNNSSFELAGITGGIILLFRNANDIVGKIIMICLRKQIKKESGENQWVNMTTPEHLRSSTPPPINHKIEIVHLRARADTI